MVLAPSPLEIDELNRQRDTIESHRMTLRQDKAASSTTPLEYSGGALQRGVACFLQQVFTGLYSETYAF